MQDWYTKIKNIMNCLGYGSILFLYRLNSLLFRKGKRKKGEWRDRKIGGKIDPMQRKLFTSISLCDLEKMLV